VLLPTCDTENFVAKLEKTTLDEHTRALIAPLVTLLRALEPELARVERTLSGFAEKDPILNLCATAPGVGLIVAATFVSVIDEARRFKNAHSVGAYLGLVPSESTTGGPNKRRLGSITKQGNRMARVMLVQAAWTILRSRDRDDPLKRWAEHLANTRGKRIASSPSRASSPACSGPCGATARSTIAPSTHKKRPTASRSPHANSTIERMPSSGPPRSYDVRRSPKTLRPRQSESRRLVPHLRR
jgi:hypothetical protein